MKTEWATPKNTFAICCLTCLAYEATRINAWYNQHAISSGYLDPGFYELAVGRWESDGLWVYAAIFLSFAVVVCNSHNPKIKLGWFLYSLIALMVVSACIPGAMNVRWAGTHDFIAAFYWYIVPLPAMLFIMIGIYTNIANKVH